MIKTLNENFSELPLAVATEGTERDRIARHVTMATILKIFLRIINPPLYFSELRNKKERKEVR